MLGGLLAHFEMPNPGWSQKEVVLYRMSFDVKTQSFHNFKI